MGKRKVREGVNHCPGKIKKSEIQISDFVWIKVPGMNILWPAEVEQILKSSFVVYIKSDNDRFSVKKSDASIMPFKEHVSVLKAEGIDRSNLKDVADNNEKYLESHKMKKYLKLFLADIDWALKRIDHTSTNLQHIVKEPRNLEGYNNTAEKETKNVEIESATNILVDGKKTIEVASRIKPRRKKDGDFEKNAGEIILEPIVNCCSEGPSSVYDACMSKSGSVTHVTGFDKNAEGSDKSISIAYDECTSNSLRKIYDVCFDQNAKEIESESIDKYRDESTSSVYNVCTLNSIREAPDVCCDENTKERNSESIDKCNGYRTSNVTDLSTSNSQRETCDAGCDKKARISVPELTCNYDDSNTINVGSGRKTSPPRETHDIGLDKSARKRTPESIENCLNDRASIVCDERLTNSLYEAGSVLGPDKNAREHVPEPIGICAVDTTSSHGYGAGADLTTNIGSASNDSDEIFSDVSEEIEDDSNLDVSYQPEKNDYDSSSTSDESYLPKKLGSDSSSTSDRKVLEKYDSDAEMCYISDSGCSDDKMSDIFPALNQNPSKNILLSVSDSSDEDEETILRDIKNPNIYIRKVLKSSTTRTGKAKMHDRVFNSYQYCEPCQKKVSNLSQHLERNNSIHDNNSDIKEIKSETDKKKKKTLQTLLRGKFNHTYNMTTIKKGKGEILLERRPNLFRLQDYGPCPKCLLWFAKKLLKKHSKKCVNQNIENLSSGDLTTQSDCLTGKIQSAASKRLINEVFSKMQHDLVTDVVKEDLLITQLGNQWLEKNVGNKLKRGVYTSQIIRLMGRFLIILRKIKPIGRNENCSNSLWDYLKPCHFDALVDACIMTASPLEVDDTLKAPSNAIKIGYDLKRILNGKIGLSIIQNDVVGQEDAENTLKLMNIYWGSKVTKAARVILLERSYYAKKNLPSPADIQRLSTHLNKKLLNFDYSKMDITNYRQIGEAVQAKLVIYNRRRTGEVQAARLRDYNRRRDGTDGEHLLGKCSELEQKLLESQEVMTIRGKVGRAVPVILPEDVRQGLRYIADCNIRAAVGIASSNEYLFASEGESIIWAYDSVKKAAEGAHLDNPQAVTSTNLRKYMATVTQVLDLKESQMQWVINHLGHTMDVHKLHYRATSDILERTQIAKILLLQDQGRIGDFKNKSLDDINMTDVVFEERENRETAEHSRVCDFAEEAIHGLVSPEVVNETLNEAETFFGDVPESNLERKKRKRPFSTAKTPWTEEEEEEIRVRFKKFFDKKVRPKPSDCLRMINKSRKENGLIGQRRKDVLKKKVYRMIDKLSN